MLNYGSEVLGLDADHTPIERVHLFALKRFLNTSLCTPNLMAYSETGRCPLFVNIYDKCINIWLRILKMPPCRLLFKACKMLYLHEQNKRTRASSVCYALYKYDFGDVWVNQGGGDEKAFLKEFKERVVSLYRQDKNWTTVYQPKNVLPSTVLSNRPYPWHRTWMNLSTLKRETSWSD